MRAVQPIEKIAKKDAATQAPGGRLFVISAPSGAGKTSLVKALRARNPELAVSVSHTTRPRRPTEQDGREYHFVSAERFEELVALGAFLEHARVFDNYYGTGKAQVQQLLAGGAHVILEIDWQGARQVRASWPDCSSIFILPPSRRVLAQRLRDRQTDSEAVIERRLRDAVSDMSHFREFDFVVVNDDFDTACADLERIIAGQGADLAASRPQLAPLLRDLLEL